MFRVEQPLSTGTDCLFGGVRRGGQEPDLISRALFVVATLLSTVAHYASVTKVFREFVGGRLRGEGSGISGTPFHYLVSSVYLGV